MKQTVNPVHLLQKTKQKKQQQQQQKTIGSQTDCMGSIMVV